MGYFPVYFSFVKLKLKGMVEYRGAFLITSFTKSLVWTINFFLIWVLISRFEHIAGWGPYEVMLLYALNLAGYSFAAFFLYHACRKLPGRIQKGELDDLLTKPFNPFLFMICREFSTGYISNVTVAITALILCLYKLELILSLGDVMILLSMLFGAALLHGALLLFTSVPAFWWVQSDGLMRMINQFQDFIRYPITIYPTFIQVLLTFVLPFAFINYYPAHYFLQKNEMLFHASLQYLAPFVGILLFFLAYRFWKLGLKQYKSTGS